VNIHYRSPVRHEQKDSLPEDELRKRQEGQMREFYRKIDEKKEEQMRRDADNRKHHDTLL
jgi:sorbin and SH3 domain containing protein 1